MSVFKQFLSQDVIVTPFKVNKSFTFYGSSSLVASNVGIDRLIGTNIIGTLFDPTTDPTTGYVNTGSYQRLVYNSIKELYYANFLSSSKGDEATLTIIDNGVILQSNEQQPSYENYLQSTLTPYRYFPTGSNDQIGIISIPSTLFGEQIKPKSFTINTESGSLIDDGEGNIYFDISAYVQSGYIAENYFATSTAGIVGNIIYSHGIITITTASISGSVNLYDYFITGSNVTMSFESTYTIHETQYKCTIRESEFNLSYNPSLLSGSTLYDYATGSFFAPYITTVGLYDEQQNLLAVAKLAQPLPSSPTTDMNIIINIDR
jgi:hypothetical protein